MIITQTHLNTLHSLNLAGCDHGSECYFIDMGEFGIKCYTEEYSRDFAYSKQTEAYQKGIAPKAGMTFEVEIRGVLRYCYTTQIATLISSDRFKELETEFEALAEKHGFPIWDICYRNVGFIDGKMVMIDFGPVTLSA